MENCVLAMLGGFLARSMFPEHGLEFLNQTINAFVSKHTLEIHLKRQQNEQKQNQTKKCGSTKGAFTRRVAVGSKQFARSSRSNQRARFAVCACWLVCIMSKAATDWGVESQVYTGLISCSRVFRCSSWRVFSAKTKALLRATHYCHTSNRFWFIN